MSRRSGTCTFYLLNSAYLLFADVLDGNAAHSYADNISEPFAFVSLFLGKGWQGWPPRGLLRSATSSPLSKRDQNERT